MHLSEYMHAEPDSRIAELWKMIYSLETRGFCVLSGRCRRHSVPNCYEYDDTVHAPYFVYGGDYHSDLTLVDGTLESRSGGATIPAHLFVSTASTIQPDTLPEGCRVLRYLRDDGQIIQAELVW